MLLKKIAVGICASVLTAGMASAADLSGKTVNGPSRSRKQVVPPSGRTSSHHY